MKKFTTIFAVVFLSTFLVAGSAMALGIPYWTPSDESTAFSITLENAGYESDFGLFAYQSPNNRVQVFSKGDEQGAWKELWFQDTGSVWQISLDDKNSWSDFDKTFGFYYGVYAGGLSDATLDYLWFSVDAYNRYATGVAVDTNIQHVRATLLGLDNALIELDDQLGGGDRDFDDMTVIGHDLTPVPEPATMLLLGVGLIGIAGASRKKLFKK